MATRSVSRVGLAQRALNVVGDFASAFPARFAIGVFFLLIVAFTLLLSLPVSRAGASPTPLADAVFTAVSVICVTGLATVDMATFWSPVGHGIILLGVEIGGVGALTLASILGLVISRKLGLRAKLMAASDGNPLRIQRGAVAEGQAVRLSEIGGLLATVAISTVLIEAAIAVLLLPRILLQGIALPDALWQSVSFSAMAFTNTGFVLSPNGLAPFRGDVWFLGVIMVGVVLGSIGFPVIYVLTRNLRRPKRWSLHVKLTLVTTGILLALGAIAYFALEFGNPATFGRMDAGQRVLQSIFLSVMTRSGGFSTVDISQLNGSSLLVTDMLMFIGGGSGSTAGGIKVTTLAILFLAAVAEARGHSEMEAFERRIPTDVLRVAVSVTLWGATTVAVATAVILQVTGAPLEFVLFDVISAFATCGLSTGLIGQLPDPAVYVLATTMFLGRVGTVTLAAALAARTQRRLFRRAEERPIVG
ncbi:TrkH family potassium uptake protein [Lacisediminihabitans profunda]|uniref:TrkH family potassium uptake protein n=1 Tax=Lacisediminihabitans profunda TaxID=2594790 RepID=A0A5C8UWD5_9MICO|nr:potassium transporter TrkG [Lacisediminihabitans profunda]TXN32353.1 TrkH family potassium uptake protein [Lacisediminihabitans profunda]